MKVGTNGKFKGQFSREKCQSNTCMKLTYAFCEGWIFIHFKNE